MTDEVVLELPSSTYTVEISTTQVLLGTKPLSAALYTAHMAKKFLENGNEAAHARVNEELTMLAEDEEKRGMTGFLRDDAGRPHIDDYVIKGFCKEAWRALRLNPQSLSAKLTAGKSKIDTLLFVEERMIPILNWHKDKEEVFERPLRADTAQGPRVALAASESLPPGMKLRFKISVIAPTVITENLLREWFAYGAFLGLGQWRSGGFGCFRATVKRDGVA